MEQPQRQGRQALRRRGDGMTQTEIDSLVAYFREAIERPGVTVTVDACRPVAELPDRDLHLFRRFVPGPESIVTITIKTLHEVPQ